MPARLVSQAHSCVYLQKGPAAILSASRPFFFSKARRCLLEADLQRAQVSVGKVSGYAARILGGAVHADTNNQQRGDTANEQQTDDELTHVLPKHRRN